MTTRPPKVFMSYSHDSMGHKDWVLALATRLVANGVDVILDQWNLNLGGDLPRFMEAGLSEADRVLAICSNQYVEKANAGSGGVGYEKMILTGELMRNVTSEKIIPVIRGNDRDNVMPTFLASRVYIDFRDDFSYEAKYSELIHEIHGQKINPRPPLGKNPFDTRFEPIAPLISFGPERYVSPALSGQVTFDYSNNNGRYVVGAGEMAFETAWSGGSGSAIHAYSDPPSIRHLALADGAKNIDEIVDAAKFDTSSRVRTPRLDEIVVWQNTAGYYLATKVEKLRGRTPGGPGDEVVFTYRIQPNKTGSFAQT